MEEHCWHEKTTKQQMKNEKLEKQNKSKIVTLMIGPQSQQKFDSCSELQLNQTEIWLNV